MIEDLNKTDEGSLADLKALDSTGKLTTNIDTVLVSLEDDINKIISKLGVASESELYLKILNLLENKPNDVADFISTPIATNEIDLYEIYCIFTNNIIWKSWRSNSSSNNGITGSWFRRNIPN